MLNNLVGGLFNPTNAFNQSSVASLYQMQMTDYQSAQTVYTQIAAAAERAQVQRWSLTQTAKQKVFQITQETTINQIKVADKLFNSMLQVVRG